LNRTHSLRLALASALVASAAVLLVAPSEASADEIRIKARGSVSVRASGHVHVGARPVRHVRVHRHHHVRYAPVYWGFRFAAPPPPPPPCYEGCGVAVNAYYTAPAPVHVHAVAPAPPPPPPPPAPVATVGIGVFAGAVDVEGNDAGGDIGLFGRLRLTHHLRLEGELSKSEHHEGARVDRRLGAALLYDFAPHGRLSPYLLGGLGVGQAELEGGLLTADTAYAELGVGLEWRLAPRFSLIGDIRAGARENRVDGDQLQPLIYSPASVKQDEAYTRGRLGAILYF
jgi:hypothetical protein